MQGSLAGVLLDGRWLLEGRVASGSFASVYRAIDKQSGGHYAVKILTEVASPEAEARFRSEFETLARLSHPHIVRGHAVGTINGRPYMVLDYVPGGNVLSLVDEGGPLDVPTAARIAVQVLSALAEAHARGVIHRDVKPGNVLVDARGDVLLCDFGIARIDGGKAQLTQVGSSLGTLLYMAPEQRLDAATVDLTADLFGVGSLLYRLVSDESPADLFALGPDAPRWNDVPEELRPIVQRATRATPAERYPDAREMAAALLELIPAERRKLLSPVCDPWSFPVPDPQVRVGTFAEEPTSPNEKGRPKRKKADGAERTAGAGTGEVRRAPPPEPSPWPWRIGVAVVAVVVMAVAGMVLGR